MRAQQPVAVVTGGARRVGRAIVESLVRDGWYVVFTYRTSPGAAEELVASTRQPSSGEYRSKAVHVDLEQPGSAESALLPALQGAGPLRLLVNNASIYEPEPATFDPTFARRIMRINAEAPVELTLLLAPLLRSGRGHVVNLLDILAERPWPRYATYCASKAALWNSTLSLARQLAPEVTVNGIAPGVVDWPDHMPQADRDAYLRKVPLGRAGTPADVAELVRFLASDGLYITGQVIRLDGGRSIMVG